MGKHERGAIGIDWSMVSDAIGCVVFIVTSAIVVWIAIATWNWYGDYRATHPCVISQTSYECREYVIDQCLADERFTLEQCIDLASTGGGN